MSVLFAGYLVRSLSSSFTKQSSFLTASARHLVPIPSLSVNSCHSSRALYCATSVLSALDLSEEMDTKETNLKRVLDEGEQVKNEGTRKKSRRKRKSENPLFREVYTKILDAAKQNNKDQAIESFRTGRDSGFHFNQEIMNSVLYLLVGGESWFENAKKACSSPQEHIPHRAELIQEREEVLEYLKKENLMTDEMVYTAQARLSACLGDPDQAFLFVKDMLQLEIPGRLRSFIPALVGFAERGEQTKALEVTNCIDSCGFDLTELEFQLVLKACTTSTEQNRSYENVEIILKRVGNELTYLQPEIIQLTRNYFKLPGSEEAFTSGKLSGKQLWLVDDVQVNEDGYSSFSGDFLSVLDLQKSDWDTFIEAFKRIAFENEKKRKHFEDFMEWYDNHGPFNLVIDGANVGFHKQNYDAGHFSFAQLESLLDHLAERFPGEKPLVVLHESRSRAKYAQKYGGRDVLDRLNKNRQLYRTPIGSNDDWYWLYGALQAREKGILISNDECRDHIFQLLTPKYFLRWKERHLARFQFVDEVPHLHMPSIYTPCTQQLSNGAWMLPYQTDDKKLWLCAKPC